MVEIRPEPQCPDLKSGRVFWVFVCFFCHNTVIVWKVVYFVLDVSSVTIRITVIFLLVNDMPCQACILKKADGNMSWIGKVSHLFIKYFPIYCLLYTAGNVVNKLNMCA